MGVLLYVLLSGCPPFFGSSSGEIVDQIKIGEYNFDLPEFSEVSDTCKDLIKKMICPRSERLSSSQVM
jgi:calcium-dependent protein kinase